MNDYTLRLFEDVLPPAYHPVYLPAADRAVYVVEGDVTFEYPTGGQHQVANSAWLGGDEIALLSGPRGARLWRWELVSATPGEGVLRSAPAATSISKLARTIQLDPAFGWMMRCDRVEFPKGGIAHTHVHQGPGIRCCLYGEIRIEAEGESDVHRAGDPWLERGFAPVLAPTTEREETAFIRCFVLPRGCKGRSSIRYVLAEDADKPKNQRYLVFGERFIDLP
jgi:hypothetical protein